MRAQHETQAALEARASGLMRHAEGTYELVQMTHPDAKLRHLSHCLVYRGVNLGWGVIVQGSAGIGAVPAAAFRGFLLVGCDCVFVLSEIATTGTQIDHSMARWGAERRLARQFAAMVGGGETGVELCQRMFSSRTQFAVWLAIISQLYTICGLALPSLPGQEPARHTSLALAKLQAMLDRIALPMADLEREVVTLASGAAVEVQLPPPLDCRRASATAAEMQTLPAIVYVNMTDKQRKAARPSETPLLRGPRCDVTVTTELGINVKSRSGNSTVLTLIDDLPRQLGGNYSVTFDSEVRAHLSEAQRVQRDTLTADVAGVYASIVVPPIGDRKHKRDEPEEVAEEAVQPVKKRAKRARAAAISSAVESTGDTAAQATLEEMRANLALRAPAAAAELTARISTAPRGSGEDGAAQAQYDLIAAEFSQAYVHEKPGLLAGIADVACAAASEDDEEPAKVALPMAPMTEVQTLDVPLYLDELLLNCLAGHSIAHTSPLVTTLLTGQPRLRAYAAGSENEEDAVLCIPYDSMTPLAAQTIFLPNPEVQSEALAAYSAGVRHAVEQLLRTGQMPAKLYYQARIAASLRSNDLAPGVELRGQRVGTEVQWGVAATRAFAAGEEIGVYGSTFLEGGELELDGRADLYRLAGVSAANAVDNYVVGGVRRAGVLGVASASGEAHFNSVLARCNHDKERANAIFENEYDVERGGVVVRATTDIAAGDSVLIDYGEEWLRDAMRAGDTIAEVGSLVSPSSTQTTVTTSDAPPPLKSDWHFDALFGIEPPWGFASAKGHGSAFDDELALNY